MFVDIMGINITYIHLFKLGLFTCNELRVFAMEYWVGPSNVYFIELE